METYQFSAIHEGSAIAFSPGSTFVATATKNVVYVRSAKTLQTVRQWVCAAAEATDSVVINDIKWSSNGSRLLAYSKLSECAWVLELSFKEPVARMEGPHVDTDWGLDDALTWTEASLTMYNLETGVAKLVQQVQGAKHAFSPDHRYMVIPERHSGKEFLGIYDSESLVRHFPVHVTEAQCLSWSPCGKWIAVADWKLSYGVLVYSSVGTKIGTFQRPASVLGVKHLSWSPNGRYLAVGGYDGAVRILESESWQPISVVRGSENGVLVEEGGLGPDAVVHFQSATTAPDTGATEVDHLGFSSDGRLMFFTQGRALHVYRFLPEPSSATPEVSHWTSIVFRNGISDTRICPTMNRVIIVNDSSMVYFWDVNGVEGVQIPAERHFHPGHVVWAPDGRSVALCDRRSFCVVYEDAACETEEQWEED